MYLISYIIYLGIIVDLSKCINVLFLKTISDQEIRCELNLSNLSNKTHTIFLDVDKITEPLLKDCIIKGCSADQSVLIISKADIKFPPFKYMNTQPNVVFSSKNAETEDLDHPILQKFLNSHWSLVYIIVTYGKKTINCADNSEEALQFKEKIKRFLDYLWHKHRIVNVVLETPVICPNKIFVYGKTITRAGLFDRGIQMLNETQYTDIANALHISGSKLTQNYPLRANMFYRFPTSITECANLDNFVNNGLKHGEYCGIDGLIMNDIVQHFGFKLIMTQREDFDSYGDVREGGNVTGSLGGIVRGNFDISFNSRFMVPYKNHSVEYLHTISHDALCVLLKIPDILPLWNYPLNGFKLDLWLVIIFTLIFMGYLMWISAVAAGRLHNARLLSWYSYIIDALTAGLFGFSILVKSQLLILRASCFCLSIVFLAVFQGHINYMFTTVFRYSAIKTLEELSDSSKIVKTSSSIGQLIRNPDTLELDHHIHIADCNIPKKYYGPIENSNVACVVRKLDASLEIIRNYTDESGAPRLYMINECFRSFYLSFISRIDFPFNDQVKKYIVRLMESGLPRKYYEWTRHALNLAEKRSIDGPQPRPFTASNLEENCIAFYLLLGGYVLSTAVFVVERWRKK